MCTNNPDDVFQILWEHPERVQRGDGRSSSRDLLSALHLPLPYGEYRYTSSAGHATNLTRHRDNIRDIVTMRQ